MSHCPPHTHPRSSSTSVPASMPTSAWTRIPPYLHRLSIPLLIGLTVLQVHFPPTPSSTTTPGSNPGGDWEALSESRILASVFFYMAAVGIILDRASSRMASSSSSSNNKTFPNSRMALALSLTRATLYAFIGDAAVAQLLLLPSSSDATIPSLSSALSSTSTNTGPDLVLTPAHWIQFALAGSMWLLGAMLWVIEPLGYWVAQSRRSRGSREGCSVDAEKSGAAEAAYRLVSQEEK